MLSSLPRARLYLRHSSSKHAFSTSLVLSSSRKLVTASESLVSTRSNLTGVSSATSNTCVRRICSSLGRYDATQNFQWVAHTDAPGDDGAPLPPDITSFADKTEDTKDLARSWVKQFSERGGIPKREFEVGYSRSSGPGGQHVNKTSTKATVRLPLHCRWIPSWAKHDLRAHPTFYVARNDSLQVSSDVHRSQSQNLAECLKKINSQIELAAVNAIPKPPDHEKLKRIARHEAKFERAQKEAKQRSKAIKQGRGKVRPE